MKTSPTENKSPAELAGGGMTVMKSWRGSFMSAGLLVTLAAGQAAAQGPAQGPPPITRPAVSPYLNLLRTDQPAGLNYYNLVRPQVEFRSSIGQLQQQTATDQQAI